WFSNIIRNLSLAEEQRGGILPVRKALICAAGPSLEDQIPMIKRIRGKQKESESIIIAVDTSLPALLQHDLEPDAVISIDCQHISYRHFFNTLPEKTRLFLDLASPPTVAARTKNRFFFSGGHPLSRYISRVWRPLPILDTSGANVAFAALSLAESIGARELTLYGADFSYPRGKTYARGTYIYSYFDQFQSRYSPLESQHSAFLYRDSSLKKINCEFEEDLWFYETSTLRFYREKVRQKETAVYSAKSCPIYLFSTGPVKQSVNSFLKYYKKALKGFCSFDPMIDRKENEETELLITILPLAAYFRRTNPSITSEELFIIIKSWCLKELDKIIHN
ncbi:MAG: DUF115 domain-containing protein, partial [Treponema sp.]|nr:DUF115 domain-containing protein [Treponema sp.]